VSGAVCIVIRAIMCRVQDVVIRYSIAYCAISVFNSMMDCISAVQDIALFLSVWPCLI
jgi:hypothetical protein